MSTKLRLLGLIVSLAIVLAGSPIAAQRQGRGRQSGDAQRPGAGGRMNQGDPEAMRERMMQRMQQQLEASQAEWQVIQPRLQKAMELSRQLDSRRRAAGAPGTRGQRAGRAPDGAARAPRGSGARGPRAEGQAGQARRERTPGSRPNADRETSAVQKAADELQQVLTSGGATSEQINAKLATLRQQRQALKQELAQARAQLQQVLTVKQEATLVLTGILE